MKRKHTSKRMLGILLTICMVVSLLPMFPATAYAETTGTCGPNLTWTLDDAGNLTISGTGVMETFSYDEATHRTTAPWGEKDVKTVTIEDGVTSIGDYAFYGCDKIYAVTIPGSVTHINQWAFFKCTALVSEVTIPEGVIVIGLCAFRQCTNLTGVKFPSSLKTIDGYAFFQCNTLKRVDIPVGVTKLDNNIFAGCESLKSVTIPDSVTLIGSNVFNGCSSLESIIIPSGVKEILWYTFRNCTSLTSVTLSQGLETIGDNAFEGCPALSSITIPSSVKEFGEGAFCNSNALTSVYFEGNAPALIKHKLSEDESYPACLEEPRMKHLPGNSEADYFPKSDSLTLYYKNGKTGWTDPWLGCKTKGEDATKSDAPIISELDAEAFYTQDEEAEPIKVTATVDDGGTLTYQWYENTINSRVGAAKIDGANSDSYTPPTSAVGTKYYYCEVTNKKDVLPPASATSSVIKITVTPATQTESAKPVITEQPSSTVYYPEESNIRHRVVAEAPDGGELTYQWYESETNQNTGGTAIPGATTNQYTPSREKAGIRYYYCVVTNTKGSLKPASTTSTVMVIEVKDHVCGMFSVQKSDAVPATCTSSGTKEYYICDCGKWFEDEACTIEILDHDSVVLPALGHDYKTTWSNDEIDHWRECTRCGDKTDVEEHVWNAEAATEEHDKHCTVCGYVAEEQLGHTHSATLVPAVEPTCTKDGNKAYYTCNCGKLFEDEACTAEIVDHGSVVLPALGHDYAKAWSKDETGHWHQCTRCGEKADVAAHTFGEWTETTPPTETEKGEKQHECTVCGYIETAEIDPIGSTDPEPGEPTDPTKPTDPKPTDPAKPEPVNPTPIADTGDTTDMTLLVTMLMVSLGGLCAVGYRKKKTEK